jgi:chaperonin cofactor prefoldin
MKKEIKLDLFDNAIDSLNEALVKYQEGKNGNEKAYKFCVLHLSHFLELLLKYYVSKNHPLLIYKNPFLKNVKKSQTIGLYEAINFLKNGGYDISPNFEKDMDWLKKLRNDIEHHTFSMDKNEVEKTIERLASAVVEFDELHEDINLSSYISTEQYDLFHRLAKNYEWQLKQAEKKVKEALESSDSDSVKRIVYYCHECNHDTMIPNEESSSGYKCAFCGNEESYDIEKKCYRCGQLWANGLMSIDYDAYICPHCTGDW